MNLSFSIRALTAILYVLTCLMLGGSAATGITMEHEKDTWISLVSTRWKAWKLSRPRSWGHSGGPPARWRRWSLSG